ncbi:MAG: hypothetical protein NT062_14925, partial [Proteobacteria bacterium]|nr:hypothetical protein [Pseudomonadota bacterium]
MAELPVKLGGMEAVPPALRFQITDVLATLPQGGRSLEGVELDRVLRLQEDAKPWIGADPGLVELGYWMIAPTQSLEMRRQGCRWLARFPSVKSVKRLAALAQDLQTPPPVREQAMWSLAARQLRAMHPATLWPVDAIAIADEALARLADAATSEGKVTSE